MRSDDEVVEAIEARRPTLFEGATAIHSLGWLDHPRTYDLQWLTRAAESLPRRHQKTVLFGMGGSSSPAMMFAEAKASNDLQVVDSSHPDVVQPIDFENVNIVVGSKSGVTLETQSALAVALAHGALPEDIVVITDPGSSLSEFAESIGANVHQGDPNCGGRFSALSPFGLIPAMYAGWSAQELADLQEANQPTKDRILVALHDAQRYATEDWFPLPNDPISSGSALWLEQLIAETTGKERRGVVPIFSGRGDAFQLHDIMHWHLVASFIAWHQGNDPYNQPNVEAAKKNSLEILSHQTTESIPTADEAALIAALQSSTHRTIQAFASYDETEALISLRNLLGKKFGPTTGNFGPRYLHSTGQLHKGGPEGIVAVQIIIAPHLPPMRISGRRYSFHDVIRAQADADFRAMESARRDVFRLEFASLSEAQYFFTGL